MKFSLTFDDTGDSIPFVAVNPDILEYYTDALNRENSNKFFSIDQTAPNISRSIDSLIDIVEQVNQWPIEILENRITELTTLDCLDQHLLNYLHANWVNSQKTLYDIQEKRSRYSSEITERIHDMYPDEISKAPIGDILKKLNLDNLYDQINTRIHTIETCFAYMKFSCNQKKWFDVINPFGKDRITNNITNLEISFNHLGRSLHDKFCNFDLDLEFNDENSFDQLLGFVGLRLIPPQTIPLSQEYISWCTKHGKVPSGVRISLGNIPDLDKKLLDYRKIILRNLKSSNAFFIKLNRG